MKIVPGFLFRRRIAPLAATASGGEAAAAIEPAAAPLATHAPADENAAPARVAAGVVLAAHGLTVRAGRRRTLNDVSLICRPGELMGIVGASGAGKSTLLRALAGVKRPGTGEVLFDGVPLYHNLAALRTRIGYVPQDDVIHRRLTVEHALRYAAALRLPRGTSRRERNARVAEVIAELGLEGQRRQLVGRLSGGQRKRVSIGVELLTRPAAFFLDEPTAGLDPGTGSRLIKLLRGLADGGRTVVLTTHVVQDIKYCDRICVLTHDGRLAFIGPPSEALTYFDVTDFDELYDRLDNELRPEEWEERFRASPAYAELQRAESEEEARRTAEHGKALLAAAPALEPGRQFGILTRRYADTLLHDRRQLLMLLLQAPLLALLLWALFAPNVLQPPGDVTVVARNGNEVRIVPRDPATGELQGVRPNDELLAVRGSGCTDAGPENVLPEDCSPVDGNGNDRALKAAQLAFILAAVAVWLGTLNAIREISREDAIFRRERLVGLRVLPYVLSKLAVLTVLVLIQSTLLLAVVGARVVIPVDRRVLSIDLPVHIAGIATAHIPYPAGPLDGVWLTLVLAGIASVAVALAVSAAVSNPDRAVVAAPLLMVPQILFAGGLTPIRDLGPAQPLSFIVATRWGYEAIGRVVHVTKVAAIPQSFPYANQLSGSATERWLILAGFALVFSALAVLLQRRKR